MQNGLGEGVRKAAGVGNSEMDALAGHRLLVWEMGLSYWIVW